MLSQCSSMRVLIVKIALVIVLSFVSIFLDRQLGRSPGLRQEIPSQQVRANPLNKDDRDAIHQESPDLLPVVDSAGVRHGLQKALEIIDTTERTDSLVALAKALTAEDPAKAWKWQSRILAFDDREAFSKAVLTSWAATQPNEALRSVESMPASALRSSCLACVLGQWAEASPAQAIDYAQTQLVGATRQLGLNAAVKRWAAIDPTSALDWAISAPDHENGTVFEAAIETWTEISPIDAASWVTTLQDNALRSRAAKALAARWAEQYPQETGEWIKEYDTALSLSDEAATVAASWAEHSPKGAANWSLGLDRTVTKREAVTQAIASWTSADPDSAAAWLDTHRTSLGDAAPAAYQSLAASWTGQAPNDAAEWLATVEDQQLTRDLAPTVFNTWVATNPDSLATWIKGHPDITLATFAHAELDRIGFGSKQYSKH